jgi:hypothetical protein
VALEASNQIDCQLIQSFPVREYISPITKISKESNPSTKRKPTSHDYGNVGGIGDRPGGRHHPWSRRLIGQAWALVWLARNISPLLHKQLVLELECRKARLELLERFPRDLLVRLAFPFDLQLPRVKRPPKL